MPARAIAAAPGIALCVAVAAAATLLARVVPLGSAPVIAIVLGLVVGTALDSRDGGTGRAGRACGAGAGDTMARSRAGLRWCAQTPLKAAVVVLGAELPLGTVAAQGAQSLPGIVITLAGCLLAARLLGRRMHVPARLRTLVGVGTAICGASAIAAVTPVIDAEETEVGYSVATIFLFNVLAVLLFPLLGHALGLGGRAFGVFAGTAVNDLSSVVAAAGLYGAGSLHTAVIVKLTRTLMIVPVCMALGGRGRIPAFLGGFVALAGLRALGVIPAGWAGGVSTAATALITLALAAVGLSIDLSALHRAGLRPIALGAALWATVSALSLGCMALGLL